MAKRGGSAPVAISMRLPGPQRRQPLYAAPFDINFQRLTSQYFPDSPTPFGKGTTFRMKVSLIHRSKGCS